MTLFRPERRLLCNSMAEVREVKDFGDLWNHLAASFDIYGRTLEPEQLQVKPYCYDDRVKWDTYIVIVDNYGVMGYTNGPLEKTEESG